MTTNKLYIEYRVYFATNTNQDLLHELAVRGQEMVYDMHEGHIDENSGPLPSPHEVTYEVIMEIAASSKPYVYEQAEGRFHRVPAKAYVEDFTIEKIDAEIKRLRLLKLAKTVGEAHNG